MERRGEDKCCWFVVVSSQRTTTEDLQKDYPDTPCLTCQGNDVDCTYYVSHDAATAFKRENPDTSRIKPQ